MSRTRRGLLLSMTASALTVSAQFPEEQPQRRRLPDDDKTTDDKLPNGKSRNDAIAQENHKKALEEAGDLVKLATQLHDEIEKAGNYVVPMNSVRRTEDIEKLAKRIRSRLKG